MEFNIDIAIVVSFLLLTILVGMGHGKDVKTLKDYALGGRNFSNAALISTIVATWASGSGFMTTLNMTFSDGLSFLLASVGGGISAIILAIYLVPRMNEFLGKMSIAEAMGDMYGLQVRVITAIAGTIGSIGVIAVQFKVFGNVIGNFLSISAVESIILAGGITTFYSAFGGIRAVTFTDMLQFFTFGVILPLLSFVIWNDFYSHGHSVISGLSESKFNFQTVFSIQNPKYWDIILLFVYFSIPTISAPIFQRIAVGKDLEQVQKAFIISGIFLILIEVLIAWIPFLIHTMDSSIQKSALLSHIINTYSYQGLKGAFIAALIAFTMSTADSRINVSSVLFTNDICKVFAKGPISEILISRIFAFFLGIGAIFLSLVETDLLSLIILANSFYYPLVTPIILMAIIGFRSTTKSALIGMSAGLISNLLWKFLAISFDNISASTVGVLLAMLSNLICFFSAHYLLGEEGGWVETPGIKFMKKEREKAKKERALYWEEVKNFSILQYIRGLNPKYEGIYLRTGVYFILFTIITMFSVHTSLLGPGKYLLSIIFPIMLITGTVITIYPLWPQSISHKIREGIMHFWWPVALFYMLILFSGFFVLLSDFNLLQSLIALLNILVLITLYKWQVSFIGLPLGFILSMKLYSNVYGPYIWKFDPGSPESVMVYLLVLVSTAIIMFVKPKQEYLEYTEEEAAHFKSEVIFLSSTTDDYKTQIKQLSADKADLSDQVNFYSEKVSDQQKEIERLGETSERILNNVTHELRLPVGNVINFTEMLAESLDKMEDKQVQMLSNEVIKNSTRLSSMILNMLDLAMLDVHKVKLNKKTMNLGELVSERVKKCMKVYMKDKPIDIKMIIAPEVLVPVDPNYMRQVVDNLVINAIKFSDRGLIVVKVMRNVDSAILMVQDQGMGIEKHELYDIFKPFKMSEATSSKAEGRGVGLALCKSAILAHGGRITVESGGIGALFTVILPLPNAGEW